MIISPDFPKYNKYIKKLSGILQNFTKRGKKSKFYKMWTKIIRNQLVIKIKKT